MAGPSRARAGRRRRAHSESRFVARRLLLLVILGVAAWGVWWSPAFELEGANIVVTVNSNFVSASDVAASVEPFIGTPLPRLNLASVELAVATNPRVLAVTATRDWPRGLTVEVTTRKPVVAVAAAGGGFVLLDADAIDMATVDAVPEGLPVVEIPLGDGNARILAAVITVLASLPADLIPRVESVSATTEDNVTLTLRDGPRIDWGSAEDSDLKARVVDVLLRSNAALAGVIDVSAPTLPVTHD